MRFEILGPVQVSGELGPVDLGPPRHRQLLVCLLQHPDRSVPADLLVERLWGEHVTRGSQGTLQGYVSLVRRALAGAEPGGGKRLTHTGAGYRLDVRPGELDVDRFEDLHRRGEAASREGDPVVAWQSLSDALALWRGPALVDGPDDRVTSADATRLEQLRLAAVVSRADAGLAIGNHARLAAELRAECAANPLHEGLRARLILALHRSGRTAEALAEHRALRTVLAEELGLEVSAELRDLERAILVQDPALNAPRPPGGHVSGFPAAPPAVAGAARSSRRRSVDPTAPVPPVRYARLDDHEIAYQSWGRTDGPTLVCLPGFAQNIELLWEEPRAASWLHRLGALGRVVHFDKLGTGLSQRGLPPSSFPGRARELLAVMDDAGVERAFVCGYSDGGTITAPFAATHPERVEGLILLGTTPSWVQRGDLPWISSEDEIRAFAKAWSAAWGTGEVTVEVLAPTMRGDAAYLDWMARYERHSLVPGAVVDLWELNIQLDVRAVLGSIAVPTLVLHRSRERVDVRCARYLAEHIPGARLEVLEGCDHLPWIGDVDGVLAQLGAFVHASRAPRRPARVLTTVLCARGSDAGPWRGSVADAAASEGGTVHAGRDPSQALATFDTPSAAVAAAERVVASAVGRLVRVGVHTGEVDRDPGTDPGPGDDGAGPLTGPAVAVAELVAGRAPTAGVLVSEAVRVLCAGSDAGFRAHGTVCAPKGAPVLVHRLLNGS